MDSTAVHRVKTIMRCPLCGLEMKSQVLVAEAWCANVDVHSSRQVEMEIVVVAENA